MTRPGSRQMEHVAALFRTLPWWQLVPDRLSEFVLEGRGEHRGLDLCTSARTSDRRLAVAYLPTPRRVVVDLEALAGPEVRLTWFNPLSGERIDQGLITAAGTAELSPPGSHDWAFVLSSDV